MTVISCLEWTLPLTDNTQSGGSCSVKRNNCFTKIQLVGQKHREKPAVGRFSALVGYKHVA